MCYISNQSAGSFYSSIPVVTKNIFVFFHVRENYTLFLYLKQSNKIIK